MKKLALANDLKLPAEAVTEKFAFLGRTGSGKTYAAMKLAELMLAAGAQIGAIDPVGVWRALRVAADKDGPSFEVVVFGGLYGDLPLEATMAAGELVATLVVDRGLSFVLDISQFIPKEQQLFLQGFAHRFFHVKKAQPAPVAVHLFMEECQEYIPENPSGLESLTLGHMQRMWKLGRNFGIGGSLISQRPQEIAKKALNMSGTLFAFQMTGPQERDTIKKWVSDKGVASDIVSVLQTLRRGAPHVEMHIETSDQRVYTHSGVVQILPRVTADLSSGAKVGTETRARRPLTPIDVEQLKTDLAATIEKAKADDPRELRKQVADLKKELGISTGLYKSDRPILTDSDRELLREFAATVHVVAAELTEKSDQMIAATLARLETVTRGAILGVRSDVEALTENGRKAFEKRLESKGLQKILAKLEGVSVAPAGYKITVPPHAQRIREIAPQNADRPPSGDTSVTRPQQNILNALRWAESLGLPTQKREKVAFLADASPKSSAFMNNLGALRTRGLIDYPQQGMVALTESGRAIAAVDDTAPTTSEELQQAICRKLPGPQARIVIALVKAHPAALDRAAVAERADASPASSAFMNNLGALRSLGLIEYPRQGSVQAADVLFLHEGR